MIGILDYGLGNVKAFANIYSSLNIDFLIVDSPSLLYDASHLIIPGVGSFDWAMNLLHNSGFKSSLDDIALNSSIPVLGVCVGMQVMADKSEEGSSSGLNWIPGSVLSIRDSVSHDVILPHMGWNTLESTSHPLFDGIDVPSFYFLHSYHYVPHNEINSIASVSYHSRFCAAIARDNIYGVQFHPEKSHFNGIQLLKNFASF